MKKDEIIKLFEVLSPSILNIQYLIEYVNFCFEKRVKQKIRGKTSSHHILPAAKTLPFKIFSNIKQNPWNLAELSYSDHYRAHYLLTKAVDHYATLYSFTAMHNKDRALGRICENDLIPEHEFNFIWNKRNLKISQRLSEIVEHDGKFITRGKLRAKNRIYSEEARKNQSIRMSGSNNIICTPAVFEKMRKTKLSRNIDKIGADKAAKTMKIKGDDNLSIYDKSAVKISQKRLEIQDNNKTLAWNANQKSHSKLREKSLRYRVLNIFNSEYSEVLPAYEVRKISPGLETKTKENYLGKSVYGKNRLTKIGKGNIIGLYCEKM